MDTQRSRELDQITLHRQADVGRLWELLMQPLGFGSRSIWLTMIGPDRRPIRALTEIAECDDEPAESDIDNLFTMLSDLLAEHGEGHSIAMLIARPGSRGVGADDRSLARMLVAGARRRSVALEPLHVATDRDVLAIAPDDLAA